MRSTYATRNMLVSIFGQGFNFLVNLIARYAFLYFLNREYLGLSSLFSELLTMLSLMELGVGQALNFSLYKPLAEQNIEKIKSLMQLYKRIYVTIGFALLVVGGLLLPIYPFFLQEIPDIPHLNLIYMMFVTNTAVSYFYSYKRALIITDQKRYIDTLFHCAFYFLMMLSQILVLALTRNYLLYLCLQIGFTWIENIVVSKKADRLYPYLLERTILPLDAADKKEITKNTKAMLLHRIGGVVVNSTDNIIITKFVGLAATGLYANYLLIINAITMLITQIFNAIVAGIGNLNACKSDDIVMIKTFNKAFFVNFWLASFCTLCLGQLLNPFILMVYGESYCFDNMIVLVLTVKVYLYTMRYTCMTFRDATGVYYYDRYKPIAEALINLVVSIALVQNMGIVGVFIGTIVSTLLTGFWVEPFVVYRHLLHCSVSKYFVRYGVYTAVWMVAYLLSSLLSSLLQGNSLFIFAIRILICCTVPNAIYFIVFKKTEEMAFVFNFLRNIKKNLLNKSA